MQLKEGLFLGITVLLIAAVSLRGLYGRPALGVSRVEWQRKVFARVLATVSLGITAYVMFNLLRLHLTN